MAPGHFSESGTETDKYVTVHTDIDIKRDIQTDRCGQIKKKQRKMRHLQRQHKDLGSLFFLTPLNCKNNTRLSNTKSTRRVECYVKHETTMNLLMGIKF